MGNVCPAKDFVNRLLSKEPSTRLSLEAALNHPWLRLSSNKTSSLNGNHLETSTSFVTNTSNEATTIVTGQNEIPPEDGPDQFRQRPPAQPNFFTNSAFDMSDEDAVGESIDLKELDRWESEMPPPPLPSRKQPGLTASDSIPFVLPSPPSAVSHPSIAPKTYTAPPQSIPAQASSSTVPTDVPSRRSPSLGNRILVPSSPPPAVELTPQKRKQPYSPNGSSSSLSSPPPPSSDAVVEDKRRTSGRGKKAAGSANKMTPVRTSARIRGRSNGTPGTSSTVVESSAGGRRTRRKTTSSPSKVK